MLGLRPVLLLPLLLLLQILGWPLELATFAVVAADDVVGSALAAASFAPCVDPSDLAPRGIRQAQVQVPVLLLTSGVRAFIPTMQGIVSP